MRIVRMKEVMAKTGLGRSSIYKLQAAGQFPQSIAISDRAVGWNSCEIESWVQQKLDARRSEPSHQDIFAQLGRDFPQWR